MTNSGYFARLWLYVAIAALAIAAGGVRDLPISHDVAIWLSYILGILSAGATTARAFIDQSSVDESKSEQK